ncbi:MAG TPA: 4Fe-4S dicluster domain-containing protein [Thiobacillaceae bacterium]|nr:4Fe-4S dicluster domain-containing protein [Thiobacillaceae bacterium]
MAGRLPVVDAGRCVHSRIETASCQACVDVCPTQAWRLDDDGLNLREAACDGCGLCQPACPGAALSLPARPARRKVAGTDAMVAVCDRVAAGVDGREGCLGCLNAIALTDLLRPYWQGYRVWLLASGDCTACPRGRAEPLYERIERLNIALRQRGRAPIVHRHVSAQVADGLLAADGENVTRRGFFRTLSRRPAAAVVGSRVVDEAPAAGTLADLLPAGDDALLPWVVELDARRCTGCHACARVCPEGAIVLDESAPAYRLRHRACTGCGLCRDVCESGAVAPRAWSEPKQTLVPLRRQRCRACGVDFHVPADASAEEGQCRICLRAKPTRRLYQVMD